MHRPASSEPATGASRVVLPCLLIFLLTSLTAGFVGAQADPKNKPPRKKSASPAAPALDLPAETPLALYDGGSVTFGEYQGWLRFIKAEDEVDKRSNRIAAIAVNEVQAAKARALKLDETEVFRIARLDFENQILHEEFRRHLAAQVKVTPEELDREVERRKDGFVRPKRVRLRNLLKRYPEGSDAEQIAQARQELEVLRQQLIEGADFAELAGRESDSQTRYRGGMIGWVTPGKLEAELEKMAFSLEVGELSPVIATGDGFTVLRCEEVDAAHTTPLPTIRKKVEERLRKERFGVQWQNIERQAEQVHVDWDAALATPSTKPLFLLGDETPLGKKTVWTVQEVQTWLHVRRQRPLQALSETRREEVVQELIEQLIVHRLAINAGLHQRIDLASSVHVFEISNLATALETRQVESRFEPLAEADIRAFYDANQERYQRPSQTQLGVILRTADRSNVRQVFRQVEQLAAQIHRGEISFEDAARQHSEHGSAPQGGLWGWKSRTQIAGGLGPNVMKTLDRLEIGQTSGLVQQPEGLLGDQHLWIVRLLDQREAKPLSFEEAKAAVERGLGNQRTRALQSQIRREVLSQLNLRVAGPDGGAGAVSN